MPKIRTTEEIFEDLRRLCREPGFLHAISLLVFRDFFLFVNLDGQVNRDEERQYSRSTLNNNELMLLIGLLVQSDRPDVFEKVTDVKSLVSRADNLLEEFHESLEAPMLKRMQEIIQSEADTTEPQKHFGEIAKEAIYYGAESAFNHQYKRFARNRYRHDSIWLLENKGLSIRPMIEIADYIEHRVNAQMTVLMHHEDGRMQPSRVTETSSALLVDKESLVQKFGQKALSFLDAFMTPINNSNTFFTQPFAFNQVNARPLLDLGPCVYLPNQFKLSESIYESPYYWMLRDPEYEATASHNRGKFLEKTIERMLKNTFGDEHVFSNVIIKRKKSEIAAEADILVVYGEFILVIQAKSKRLTLEARSGNLERLKEDFGSGVQSAYDQAIKFIDLIVSGAECEIAPKKFRKFEFLARAFPLVILSDHFPSLSMLSNDLIKTKEGRFPVVTDVFFLDVLLKVLNDPVELLYYLQQRTRFFEKIHTDSEYNLLGFHMKHKLYVSDEHDFVMIDKGFAADIDDYIIASEVGRPCPIKFVTLEERIGLPTISTLVSLLKSWSPDVCGIAIELLDFSSQALQGIADHIHKVQAEVRAGKALKAFSIETHYAGISYVAANKLDQEALSMAEMIALRYKYAAKKDRWYVIFDLVDSPNLVDSVLPICEKWAESKEMEELTQNADRLLKSTFVPFNYTEPASENDSPT